MTRNHEEMKLPPGAVGTVTVGGYVYKEEEGVLTRVSLCIEYRGIGLTMESCLGIFALEDQEHCDALLRELDAFGVTLEHADDLFDALDDALGRTVAVSAPPDGDDRCAYAALPRRRWRPNAAQRRNRRDNYGFDRPLEGYGESRYVPRGERAPGALQRIAARLHFGG